MALHCPFFDIGCPFLPSDINAVRVHLRDQALHHLTLLCQDVHQLFVDARSINLVHEKQQKALEDMDNRVIALEHNPGAHLIWKIDEYKEKFNQAKTGARAAMYSPPFLSGRNGYKLILLVSLNGDGQAKGKFMSVFVSLCRGDHDAALQWPFSHTIKLTLMNQAENPLMRKDVSFVIKPHLTKENKPFVGQPQTERNAAFGAQNFVELELMQKMEFVKDDCIYIRVDVNMENM